MNDKTRKILPLVGALALTSSALLAGSGAALAGKADPDATLETQYSGCEYNGTTTYYVAQFNLDGNKGRWVFLEGELVVGGVTVAKLDYDKYDKNPGVALTKNLVGTPESATAFLSLGDRKGAYVDLEVQICP